uniref:Integrase catalytic domain-containing protein n=1 Tax=Trichuris muris TaxID=70415 RepID=A0A5S6QKN7_TRIMR
MQSRQRICELNTEFEKGHQLKNLQNLKRDTNWWNGPAWLMKEEHVWPSLSTNKSQAEESEPETLLCLHAVDEMEGISLAEKYGNFDRLIRITAICLRFADNCRCPQQLLRVGPMTTSELRNAQSVWFRIVQREAFPKEIERLRSLKGLSEDNKIYKLDPFLSEDRLIRMKGRIDKADLPYNARHPIILPHNHVVVDLLIRHCHERQLHAGTEHTLAVLRQGFWILKARSAVKRIIKDCRICRRFTSTHYTQQMAPLPEDRITQAYPFERTGLDFAGPLYVKRGRSVKKVYICLFTCMTIRAIHLELVTDMSTGQFLLAFRRFVAHRGNPATLQSDNSKTFKAADRELRQLFNRQSINEIRRELCSKGVTWKFITERAPWTGGYWERLVRSVKTPLRKVLGHALLTEQEITTVLTEVEARVNSRPLTFIGEDPKDMNVLTPFHFLIGREFRALPDQVATEESVIMIPQSGDEMRQRWRYQQRLVAHFWKRWRREYITTLATRNKWCGTRTPPMVGDIVLIAEENVPRTRWSMGKIVEVLPGSDGMVRSVRLRTIRGIITRPIAKLHLIEQGTAL